MFFDFATPPTNTKVFRKPPPAPLFNAFGSGWLCNLGASNGAAPPTSKHQKGQHRQTESIKRGRPLSPLQLGVMILGVMIPTHDDIHEISANNLKATCRMGHSKCVCWVSSAKSGTREDILLTLVQWVGKGKLASEEQHYQMCVDLRKSFGMRIK